MFPENTAKPGELYYLLGELYEAKKSFSYKKEQEIYIRLLEIADWYSLSREIEKISDPVIRFSLRGYQEEYIGKFILYHIAQLELSEKENPTLLSYLLYLMGLLEEKNLTFEEFEGSLFVLQKRVEHLLEKTQKNWRRLLLQVRDKRLSSLLKKCLRKSLEEMIGSISQVLFREERIEGDYRDFFNPRSHLAASLLNGYKKAIPISVGALFLLIAQRLSFPIYAISLPRHFFLKFEVEGLEFYIDPFNEGKILPKASIMHFLKNMHLPFSRHFFESCDYAFILKRNIESLIPLYQKRREWNKEDLLKEIRYYLAFS